MVVQVLKTPNSEHGHATLPMRYFVRFGEIPEANKSKLWAAPNSYWSSQTGTMLPGLSVYEVTTLAEKWELMTDEINVGSGMASLLENFHRAVNSQDYAIYLLTGQPSTWESLTASEKEVFEDWYPGEESELVEFQGTDGEPLLGYFEIIRMLQVDDLICKMIEFPEEWEVASLNSI